MLVPPTREEHPPIIPEIVLVADYPHEAVMDDECHKRPFLFHSISMEKPEMLHAGKNFFKKKSGRVTFSKNGYLWGESEKMKCYGL